ncbi:MAG: cell division protein FtsK [Streptosporangiales bacterium]|nr:cell division protein FtsK [Streptosporangiales bacterium]
MSSRRHLANARRRYRRGEATPLLVLGDDREPGQALVFVAKLAFRYRSELAPFTLALVELVTAAWLHHAHPSWAPWLAVATVVVGAGLALVPARWTRRMTVGPVFDRAVERSYAVLVTTVVGGWLAAAIWWGPLTYPLSWIGFIAGVVAAIPWWTHRRRRSRARLDRTIAAWPDIAEKVGLPDSKATSGDPNLWGYVLRLVLRKGHTYETAANQMPAIESGLGTRRGAVRVEPVHEHAGQALVRVVERDPHAAPIDWPDPTRPSEPGQDAVVPSITRPVPLGVFEDATTVHVSLLRRHVLIGGTTGAGKSGVVNVVLAAMTGCPDVVVWGIDLKAGMELGPWTSCLPHLATNPDAATALLQSAVAELDGRAGALATAGERTWAPTPTAPALVIVIDEYAELPDAAHRYADSIARRGRGPAVTLVVATQRPTQQAMGRGAVRSQMDVRIALRVREQKDTDLILGQGMLGAGWHPHRLDKPGTFLLSAPEHGTPRRARGYLLTDAQVGQVAARHSARRPLLPSFASPPVHEPTTDGKASRQERRSGANTASSMPVGRVGVVTPETTLWALLRGGPEAGASVGDLVVGTGMSRRWVYLRLREHVHAGRVRQVTRGKWRATEPHLPPTASEPDTADHTVNRGSHGNGGPGDDDDAR